MDDFEDRTSIMDALQTIYYTGGTTATSEGLDMIKNDLFGGSGSRRGAVIVTLEHCQYN